MRVPSASLSWIDVDGRVSSTTRLCDGDGTAARSVGLLRFGGVDELAPPRVLPTP